MWRHARKSRQGKNRGDTLFTHSRQENEPLKRKAVKQRWEKSSSKRSGSLCCLLQEEQAGHLLNTFGKGREIIVLMNVQETIAAPAGGL